MRRAGNLWPRVVAFEGLRHAALRAARGQRTSAGVARFLERTEPEILRLQRELRDGSWRPGPCSRFEIHDPKRRTITAVPFRDRVVHHALIAPLEPILDRRMIAHSYACRRGKGAHAAVRRVRRLVRTHRRFLKLDVRSFFGSIRHEVVRETLERIVKDRRVLELCDVIVTGSAAPDSVGVGLPIGSLTSQWFANTVLDRLDHHVCETLRLPAYVRYMDDMVFFADDRSRLSETLGAVRCFLRQTLRLELKDRATRLAPTATGVPFLGWRIFPGTVRLAPVNLRRHRWRLRHRRWEWETGRIDAVTYRRAVASALAHVRHGDTRALRRRWFADHAVEL